MSETFDDEDEYYPRSCGFCGRTPNEEMRVLWIGKQAICQDCAYWTHYMWEMWETDTHTADIISALEEKKDTPTTAKPTSEEMIQAIAAITHENETPRPSKIMGNFTPMQIKARLDEFVIGQEKAKKILAVAVYNHYKRLDAESPIGKSNILLLGPTGSGKTLLVETLGKILSVPVLVRDGTQYTSAGYVGDTIENIITELAELTEYNATAMQSAIIFIDEIDKLISRKERNGSPESFAIAVQSELLKLVEGKDISLRKGGKDLEISTKNILFIVGGSFEGLQNTIQDRLNKKAGMGFISEVNMTVNKTSLAELITYVQPEDFKKFGVTPELLGRLPIHVGLEALTVGDLEKILTEPNDALVKQYQALFRLDNVDLVFRTEALQKIAERALKEDSGARGLRHIMESMLLNLMYTIPTSNDVDRVIVDEDMVEGKDSPVILYKDGNR